MMNAVRNFIFALVLLLAAPAFALDLPSLGNDLASVGAASQDTAGQTLVSNNVGAAAQNMVTKMGDKAMATIKDTTQTEDQKKQTFRALLGQNFDMPTIARFALGAHWRTATPAQQQEYMTLYQKMVIDIYTSRFNRYSGQSFDVTGNRVDESGDIIVSSKVQGNGNPVMVDWRVRAKGGVYRVIDVMVEGVSMAVTQRNDFSGIIAQGGGTIDALIDYLKKGGTSDVDN